MRGGSAKTINSLAFPHAPIAGPVAVPQQSVNPSLKKAGFPLLYLSICLCVGKWDGRLPVSLHTTSLLFHLILALPGLPTYCCVAILTGEEERRNKQIRDGSFGRERSSSTYPYLRLVPCLVRQSCLTLFNDSFTIYTNRPDS